MITGLKEYGLGVAGSSALTLLYDKLSIFYRFNMWNTIGILIILFRVSIVLNLIFLYLFVSNKMYENIVLLLGVILLIFTKYLIYILYTYIPKQPIKNIKYHTLKKNKNLIFVSSIKLIILAVVFHELLKTKKNYYMLLYPDILFYTFTLYYNIKNTMEFF